MCDVTEDLCDVTVSVREHVSVKSRVENAEIDDVDDWNEMLEPGTQTGRMSDSEYFLTF